MEEHDGMGAAAWVVASVLLWLVVAGAALFVALIR